MKIEKQSFIKDSEIRDIIKKSEDISSNRVREILKKARGFKGLSAQETAILLKSDNEFIEEIYEVAGEIKKHIYGDRVVMFAPLYVSDYCVNKCTYCGFGCDNNFKRRKLTMEEIGEEIKILEKMGHKRLALEAGEDPVNCSIDYILECINFINNEKTINGEIRRVNVNIAATTVENYKKLKDAEIGTYILFQETYNEEAYKKVHTAGPKSNYDYHTLAHDRAMLAGIDDIGGGVLFGLYDYVYEVVGLMLHNKHLEDTYGHGFHTISVPRLCEAMGTDKESYSYLVDDETLKKIVAILRIAVPYVGIIISTRENEEMRKELISIGTSQLSAGSSVDVGGYSDREKNGSQFDLSDNRTPIEINKWLLDEDLLPSFCTACYRQGRTGDRFMELAKSGNIKNVCLPNGLLTLKEYSLDYGDENFREKTNDIINKKINDIENKKVKELVKKYLVDMENGKRDLYL